MSVKLSVVILTYKRDDALEQTLGKLFEVFGYDPEVQMVLVDNNADGRDRASFMQAFANSEVVSEGYNLGVAAGRNKGIAKADGDIVLFLDDDAVLDVRGDFLRTVEETFAGSPRLGAIAFRSFVGDQRIEDPIEFPHTDKLKDHASSFATFRFIGVAHLIRHSALIDVGNYCDAFFYGMEEFDLSYRLLKRGWEIRYASDFRVRHMKADAGRMPSKSVIRRMYANKLAVGWMHLPLKQFCASGLAWFVKTTIDARSPVVPMRAIGDFLAMAAHGRLLRRDPSKALVDTIRSLGGKAWK